MYRSLCVIVVLLTVYGVCGQALASEFCVRNSGEFQTASSAIHDEAGSHILKIVEGTYLLDHLDIYALKGLRIEGGYAPDCLVKQLGASRTILRGADDAYKPSIHAFDGVLSVSDVWIDNFPGLYLWSQSAYSTELHRVMLTFRSTMYPQEEALGMTGAGGATVLENMVLDATTFTGGCAMDVGRTGPAQTTTVDYLTVINRGAGNALCVTGVSKIRNSLMLSSNIDLVVDGAAANVQASVYTTHSGAIDPLSMSNLTGPVDFEDGTGFYRYRLADSVEQTSRDSGQNINGLLVDVGGLPRKVGIAPDRGAFEAQRLGVFDDGFELLNQ